MHGVGDRLSAYRGQLQDQGYSPATVNAKVTVVALAAAHAGVLPEYLTRSEVLAWLGSSPRSDWTRIKYLSHLSAWFGWLGVPDATAGIRRPRTPVGLPKPVSEEDLAAMLALATGRVRAWVLLGAYCGLRAHESAKVSGVDYARGVDGDARLRVLGKGGTWGVVPVPPVVAQEMDGWVAVAGRGRLWPDATSATVQRAVRRLADRAGVDCSSHQLRHRYGTAVYAAQQDLLLTQRLMRHRSPATTAGYAAVAGDRVAAVVASLPGAHGDTGRTLRVVR
jgi:integrase